jgi:hypothetical protein
MMMQVTISHQIYMKYRIEREVKIRQCKGLNWGFQGSRILKALTKGILHQKEINKVSIRKEYISLYSQ